MTLIEAKSLCSRKKLKGCYYDTFDYHMNILEPCFNQDKQKQPHLERHNYVPTSSMGVDSSWIKKNRYQSMLEKNFAWNKSHFGSELKYDAFY